MGFLSDLTARQTKFERAMKACKTGDLDTLALLLKSPRSIEPRPVGFTSIRAPPEDYLIPCATIHRQPEALRLLLDAFPRWDISGPRHELAIDSGADVYRVYVQKHPELLEQNIAVGMSPLATVAARGDVDFVRFLVGMGADVAGCRIGGQPIMDFLSEDSTSKGVYRVLLEAGAKPGYRHAQ